MRVILLCLLLAGCATKPQVVHVTWVKDSARDPYSERIGKDNCLIVTNSDLVNFADFGRLFKSCLK